MSPAVQAAFSPALQLSGKSPGLTSSWEPGHWLLPCHQPSLCRDAALLGERQFRPQERCTLGGGRRGHVKSALWQLSRRKQFSQWSMGLVSVCGQWSSSEQTGPPSYFARSLGVCIGCERELRSQPVLHKVTRNGWHGQGPW